MGRPPGREDWAARARSWKHRSWEPVLSQSPERDHSFGSCRFCSRSRGTVSVGSSRGRSAHPAGGRAVNLSTPPVAVVVCAAVKRPLLLLSLCWVCISLWPLAAQASAPSRVLDSYCSPSGDYCTSISRSAKGETDLLAADLRLHGQVQALRRSAGAKGAARMWLLVPQGQGERHLRQQRRLPPELLL